MNNFKISFMRFLKNKNTVTVIGVLVGVLILYFGYNMRINNELKLVSVPYAKKDIQPRTKITADMIGTVRIPAKNITSGMLTNSNNIINKYSYVNSMIPQGSYFYSKAVVEREKLPDAFRFDIKEGYSVFNLAVDPTKAYGILPGTYIDVYFKAFDDDNQLMVGKLIENIKVSVVVDKSGKPVYENSDETRLAATFIFAVPEEIHLLLRKANYLKKYQVELFPSPRNTDSDVESTVTSSKIKEFIESKTVEIPIEVLPNPTLNDATNTEIVE